MNNSISIMQGRLLPPFEGRFQAFPASDWQKEFHSASSLGLHSIEWIYEKPHEEHNPVGSSEGIQLIQDLASQTGVGVYSVCADYYMTECLIANGEANQENWNHLSWLCAQASSLGVTYIVLPFVDSSSLQSIKDRHTLAHQLREFVRQKRHKGVELHLETDLPPQAFASLLNEINNPFVKMNYDIGNSASLGYNPDEEFTLLGQYLGSVHVKDRMLGGKTVQPGTGSADFDKCFAWFKKLNFQRWFVLQTAREESGLEDQTINQHIHFTQKYMKQHAA